MSKSKERSRAWELEQIAKATKFTAIMFLGRGKFDKRWASSLEEAYQHRTNMLREYEGINYGRKVLIYAVTPGIELSILVE